LFKEVFNGGKALLKKMEKAWEMQMENEEKKA